ncbi:pyridoxamine 5'-phosphate oxidase family protein [Aeromicrobium ginsengisoli]|uniref:Pyridoxamine 5'-phosphate oxidase family protein n=1 Tax=Aeromicrobium ginsengisoli TaxID=363867 RepID=A0A5M4FB53_9ACTN|nr:pyridoxamine 5'-phosphate oxidase family protein [Aeromicrobium ginsengisoli]KAA1395545.1 pyridoxamine 5'-phosphate oxidase family protein [Aeromicrobium ginsengisoli]
MTTRNDDPTTGSLSTLSTLSEKECRELLGTTTVGHIAFVDRDGQQLIPANFAVLDGVIYLRTAPGSILSQLASGHPDVAFGINHHDVFRTGWNVTVRGTAVGVEDRATINVVLGHKRLRPWAGGVRPLIIRVTPSSMAGRRVSGNTA